MAKPDFTLQDATTYKTNIDLEVGYLYDTGLVAADGSAIVKKVDAGGTTVNYLEVVNAQTANDVIIRAAGTDTNIDLDIQSKGTGDVLVNGKTIGMTEVVHSTLSGTSDTFSSLPAGLSKIEAVYAGVSANATSTFRCQVGDSGGLHTTGYNGAVMSRSLTATTYQAYTSGLNVIRNMGAANTANGMIQLQCVDPSTDEWVFSAIGWTSGGELCHSSSRVTLDTDLDRIAFDFGGTNTFDAGTITIRYE